MKPKPRVLVACEFSGAVRRAFRDTGCDAWSCDLLPAEDGSEYHLQGDVLGVLYNTTNVRPFDLIVAHPPCTYLANSGVRWLVNGAPEKCLQRYDAMLGACKLFAALWHAPCQRVAIENPVMHKYAREELGRRGVPGYQCSFQPWEHGHGEVKRTLLWLRGLPRLSASNVVEGREARVHRSSPSPDRWKERSRTLDGVARAMAEQWTPLVS